MRSVDQSRVQGLVSNIKLVSEEWEKELEDRQEHCSIQPACALCFGAAPLQKAEELGDGDGGS